MPESYRHVLIIDPDTSVEESLRPILADYGYSTRTATTADRGYQEVVNRPPALILLAISLPDNTGVNLFEMVRKRSRSSHVPIMFVAGYGEGKLQKEMLETGADDFVAKPFDADLLALRIRNAIQRTERDGLTHPRTGLPTGRLLRERIRDLADEYGWYKIDVAIDHFDAFVSRYGFMAAEEVVGFAAGLIQEVVQSAGASDAFIGQRDDNNFTVITTLEQGAAIAAQIERRFNEEVLAFYTFVERDQGYIEVEEGDGFVQKPLMSASTKHQEGEPEDE
jgi:PleD family two-component response regulator